MWKNSTRLFRVQAVRLPYFGALVHLLNSFLLLKVALGGTMPSCWREPAVVTEYIRKLNGGSQSILARASDGAVYVVKFRNDVHGPNLLFNEAMGTELFRTAGIPVPSWRLLVLTNEFAEANVGCWMETPYGYAPPQPGLCFGSRYLGEDDSRIFEILPGSSLRRVRNRVDFWLAWLLDVCAGHADNRQAIFKEDKEGSLEAVFIDHGRMFSGSRGNRKTHVVASRYYLDPRIYPNVCSETVERLKRVATDLNADGLWARVLSLPDEWITQSALSSFTDCLEALSSQRAVEKVLDRITTSQHPTYGYRRIDDQRERIPVGAVLRSAIQSAGNRWAVCA